MAPTVTATFQLPLPRTPAALSFEAPVRRDSSVQLYAMIRGTDSYGGVSRSLARALVDARVDVSLCDYTVGGMGDDSLATHEGLNRDAAVGLFHGFPEHAP